MSANNIFAQTAPLYWSKGLSAIPLWRQEKRPIPNGWQQFHDAPVPLDTQKQWLLQYPDSNIGLVLGKQSGVIALDIDTEDTRLIQIITGLLPPSPWRRIGKKGMVLAYRYNGIKTFRIKTATAGTICECLSDRTQIVLPPSIHPDTKQPYGANCNLYDVIHGLHELPDDIEERLRGALKAAGVELSHSGWTKVTEFVSAGSRDTVLTEKAGLFAFAVIRGERTLVDAIGMLRASMDGDLLQQVAGDPVDPDKHIRNLLLFLRRDVMEKKKVLPEGWDLGLTPEDKKAMGVDFDKDLEEWSYQEIETHLTAVFREDVEKGTGLSLVEVEKMLAKIAHSRNLTPLEVERILNYIAKNSNLGLKPSSLMRQIRQIREGDGIKGLDHTELASDLIKDIELVCPFRYHLGSFWKWAGSHWEAVKEDWLIRKISLNYGHLPAARRNPDIKGIVNLTRSLVREGLTESMMPQRGVNFANGYLTPGLELLTHAPDHGLTYTLPFRYLDKEINLNRDAPIFCHFLETSWGQDADFVQKVMALQEALAVTLFGLGSRFQRVILLHGMPKSGKSQLLTIARSLVPETARAAVRPEDWSDRFLPAQLADKILNVAGELSEYKRIDGQVFKDIVDGSEIMARHIYGKPFSFRPICTHWFASNHFPKTSDSSEGFTRRWLVLNFTRAVPDAQRKLDLGDVIVAQEREAIASWAVQALPRLLHNNDFTLPDSHKTIVGEIGVSNNLVRRWLVESKEVAFDKKLSIAEETLYQNFWGWSLSSATHKPISQLDFRQKMRELGASYGFQIEQSEGMLQVSFTYYGIGFK